MYIFHDNCKHKKFLPSTIGELALIELNMLVRTRKRVTRSPEKREGHLKVIKREQIQQKIIRESQKNSQNLTNIKMPFVQMQLKDFLPIRPGTTVGLMRKLTQLT